MHLCRAHNNGYGHCLSQPCVSGHAEQHDDGGACQLLRGRPCGRWRAKLQGQQRQTGQRP
jgi:hypothetical protein